MSVSDREVILTEQNIDVSFPGSSAHGSLADVDDVVPPPMPAGQNALLLSWGSGLQKGPETSDLDLASLVAMVGGSAFVATKSTPTFVSPPEANLALPSLAGLDPDLQDRMRQWELAVQNGTDDRFDWSSAIRALATTRSPSKALLEFGNSICFIDGDVVAMPFYQAAIGKAEAEVGDDPAAKPDTETIAAWWDIGRQFSTKNKTAAARIFALLARIEPTGSVRANHAADLAKQLGQHTP